MMILPPCKWPREAQYSVETGDGPGDEFWETTRRDLRTLRLKAQKAIWKLEMVAVWYSWRAIARCCCVWNIKLSIVPNWCWKAVINYALVITAQHFAFQPSWTQITASYLSSFIEFSGRWLSRSSRGVTAGFLGKDYLTGSWLTLTDVE